MTTIVILFLATLAIIFLVGFVIWTTTAILVSATLGTIVFVCFTIWLSESEDKYYRSIGYMDSVDRASIRLLQAQMYNRR